MLLSYLRAIGLSFVDSDSKINQIVSDVMEQPSEKITHEEKDKEVKIEYIYMYNEKIGLLVRGTKNSSGEIIIHTLLPYIKAAYAIKVIETEIEENEERKVYYVFCEEDNTGTEIDFCLLNVMEYMKIDEKEEATVDTVQVVGLSTDGKVILNVEKDEVDFIMDVEEERWRKQLLEKARLGDEEAQELLEIEAEEMEDIIEERLQQEDLYSILEEYLMPYGEQEGVYSVLGSIEKVEELINEKTNEFMYILHINCMEIMFEMVINKKDLVGEPLKGRRFVGTCWFVGEVLFNQ